MTYEGREGICSWKCDVADRCGVLSHVKGVPWFWKRRKATLLRAGGTERSCLDSFICDIVEAVATAAAVSSCCDDSRCSVVVATGISY